jgi:hypothetical protein
MEQLAAGKCVNMEGGKSIALGVTTNQQLVKTQQTEKTL